MATWWRNIGDRFLSLENYIHSTRISRIFESNRPHKSNALFFYGFTDIYIYVLTIDARLNDCIESLSITGVYSKRFVRF